MNPPLKALSISRPWPAAFMLRGGYGGPGAKRIENRSRKDGRRPSMCRYRGPLLLHAAKSWDEAAIPFMLDRGLISELDASELSASRKDPRLSFLQPGVIFAHTRVFGHIEPSGDPDVQAYAFISREKTEWMRVESLELLGISTAWWAGDYALIFSAVCPTPPVWCRGKLGLWDVPDDVLSQIDYNPMREQMEADRVVSDLTSTGNRR